MKKILSFVLFLFIISISIFGYSGVLAGEENLKIVKTEWFDIIYPERCEKSASLLYENADRIFEEVASQYGLKPSFPLSVVITPAVDSVNAFFTSYPYNRIVLYDTSSQDADELSTVFSETFLSVFRHELTHAVTFNIKNGFWSGVTKFFGDGFMPGAFFVTSGMAEGAAVASESAEGEGRLNNEYAKHFVKQSKIENKFPNYFDVQGAADSLIPGIQYYFNGAFHQWLQETYGMEKYANFWYRVTNLSRIGVMWSFRKVYGISIRKAWKNFASDYYVPDVKPNPVGEKSVADFFNISLDNSFSHMNKGGFRYFSLKSSDKGIIYSDLYGKKVFFISNDVLNNRDGSKEIKPDVLFSQSGLNTLNVSKDGRFIAVSYIADNEPNITSKIKIYDTENNSFFYVDEKGIKNGAVISDNGNYYLICHKYNSPYNFIMAKRLCFSETGRIKEAQDIASVLIPLNMFCCNFIDLGSGRFGYIRKDKLDFYIGVSEIIDDKNDSSPYINFISEYKMPEGVVLHDISESNGNIYFSWACKDTMPRFGFISMDKGDIFLSDEDISGGIFNPVAIDSAGSSAANKSVVYIGEFFRENRILTFDFNSEITENGRWICRAENIEEHDNSSREYIDTDISLIAQDYKSFKHINNGLLIPFSLYSSEVIGAVPDSFVSWLPFGITYANTSPWSNGTDDLFLFTSGWGFLTNSLGFGITLNKGTGTSLFNYTVDLKTEFDRNGWKNSSGKINLSSGFSFGKYSSFAVENDFNIAGGRFIAADNSSKSLFEKYKSYNKYGINISDVIFLGYSNIHRTGPGRFEKAGITVKAGAAYLYDSSIGDGCLITSDLLISIPKLIPVIPKDNFVYNMPLKLSLSLFPVNSFYGGTRGTLENGGYGVLDANIETVLFGMDVQRAIPYFDILFIQDFYLTFGYSATIASYKGSKRGFQLPYMFEYIGNLASGKSLYLDSLYMKLVMDLSANIGVLANSMIQTGLFGQVRYILNDIPGAGKGSWKADFGFGALF